MVEQNKPFYNFMQAESLLDKTTLPTGRKVNKANGGY
jgi:hypothetical protein